MTRKLDSTEKSGSNWVNQDPNGKNLYRQYTKFLRHNILDAVNLGRAKKAKDGPMAWKGPIDLVDLSCPGLQIRIEATKSVWYYKDNRAVNRDGEKKGVMAVIRDVRSGDWDGEVYETIKLWASEARIMVGKKIDRDTIKKFLADKGRGGPVEREHDPEKDGWTWEIARDKWLADISETKSPNTIDDYKKVLTNEVFDDWVKSKKLLKQITHQDVATMLGGQHVGNHRGPNFSAQLFHGSRMD